MPRDNRCVYMAHVCFYVCCSDCVGVCGNVCCVAAVVKNSGVFFGFFFVVVVVSPVVVVIVVVVVVVIVFVIVVVVVVVYPLPWPLLVGGVRCSRLWSTSQLLHPSGQQCSHSGGVCPQIQGRQCGAYVGAVEEMMCVVCVDVTEGT